MCALHAYNKFSLLVGLNSYLFGVRMLINSSFGPSNSSNLNLWDGDWVFTGHFPRRAGCVVQMRGTLEESSYANDLFSNLDDIVLFFKCCEK